MHSLTVKSFRCFSEPGPTPIRPLTVLIGENSTGKSSFLAAARLTWDLLHSPRMSFNDEPFLLGAFDQIAHVRGGPKGRAATFSIGFSENIRVARVGGARQEISPTEVHFEADFQRSGSHPLISRQKLTTSKYSLVAKFGEHDRSASLDLFVAGDHRLSLTFPDELPRVRMGPEGPMDWRYGMHLLSRFQPNPGETPRPRNMSVEEAQELESLTSSVMRRRTPRPVALAPVRTRPARTYNPVSELPEPEGEHIPMVLAKTFFEKKQKWVELKGALDRFGKASGLFSSLDIKALGRHEGDPFQIRVKINGPAANLIDVGYGVSQVLPILVDSLMSNRGELYLLQQPEVHLHPKAQAELGSFLAALVAADDKRFIVETHSDYLIDRLRMEVRDKRIKPSDVAILFFERRQGDVAIHPMEIDDTGNLLHPPKGFRKFFLDEDRRLLGI